MPKVVDVAPIREALAALTTGEPLCHGALTVVPLLCPGLTLGEAGDAVRVVLSKALPPPPTPVNLPACAPGGRGTGPESSPSTAPLPAADGETRWLFSFILR